jgi:formylglycine-generating enzyme required for sulfatase activity
LHYKQVSPQNQNTYTSNLVFIPGGKFTMGVKSGRIQELKPHTVTINSIKIGKYEVTQKQWEAIMGPANNNSINKGCFECPVENVSWIEVDSFIRKINTIGNMKFSIAC